MNESSDIDEDVSNALVTDTVNTKKTFLIPGPVRDPQTLLSAISIPGQNSLPPITTRAYLRWVDDTMAPMY